MDQEKLSVLDLDVLGLQGKVLQCKIEVADIEYLNLANGDDFLDHIKKRLSFILASEIINSYAVFTKSQDNLRGQTNFIARAILVPKEVPTQFFKYTEVKKALAKL